MQLLQHCCLVVALLATTRAENNYLRGGSYATDLSLQPSSLDSPDSSFSVEPRDDDIAKYMHGLEAGGVTAKDQAIAEVALNLAPRNATAEASGPRRTLVVAKYDEDVTWLQQLPKNFDTVVYQSKNESESHFVQNVGNEASKYLSYIVEHYDALPDTMAFLQAGRQDWHDPLPKDVMIRAWDWGQSAKHGGFTSLPTNAPCLVEDAVRLASHAAPAMPAGLQCPALVEHVPKQMATIREVWPSVFEQELGPLPQRWVTHCCAQFEVTREAVQRHSLEFYRGLLSWVEQHDQELLSSSYGDDMKRNHDPSRRDAGHVMEPVWVLLFSTFDDQAVRLPNLAADAGADDSSISGGELDTQKI